MPKFRVMVGRPTGSGSTRSEIANWMIEVVTVSLTDPHLAPLIEDVDHVPIQRFPTNIARNELVDVARSRRADILAMVDDDVKPPEGFFKTAVEFLIAHHGPAIIACPYVTGGDGREDVCVFEWGQGTTGDADAPFAVTNIVREDAARRTGIERVPNVGTGLIFYRLDAFDAFQKVHKHDIFFDYGYDARKRKVIETEDCYNARLMNFAGVPIYVHWDFWLWHRKSKWCVRPTRLTDTNVGDVFMRQARAEVANEFREAAKKEGIGEPVKRADMPEITLEDAQAALEETQSKLAAQVARCEQQARVGAFFTGVPAPWLYANTFSVPTDGKEVASDQYVSGLAADRFTLLDPGGPVAITADGKTVEVPAGTSVGPAALSRSLVAEIDRQLAECTEAMPFHVNTGHLTVAGREVIRQHLTAMLERGLISSLVVFPDGYEYLATPATPAEPTGEYVPPPGKTVGTIKVPHGIVAANVPLVGMPDPSMTIDDLVKNSWPDNACATPSTDRYAWTQHSAEVIPAPPLPPEDERSGPLSPPDAARWAMGVEGWMAAEELLWLAEQAATLKAGDVWVEIGSYKGRSTSAVYLALADGTHLYAVDTWDGRGEVQAAGIDSSTAYAEWKATMDRIVWSDPEKGAFLHAWQTTSLEAASRTLNGNCTVVFIDGSHDYESVKADIEAWRGKVRPGGLLAGHDRNEPGVHAALLDLQLLLNTAVQYAPGSIWYVRIPEPDADANEVGL